MGFQIVITVLACGMYVWETYEVQSWMFVIEFGLSLFFAIDYILFFYCSPDRLVYVYHLERLSNDNIDWCIF